MTTSRDEEGNDVPGGAAQGKHAGSARRAVLQALAGAPVILTLMSGRAKAEYVGGVYFPGSCRPPSKKNGGGPPCKKT